MTTRERRAALGASIADRGFLRIIEAHNGLSGLVGEAAVVDRDGRLISFDGLWESSLTDSASKGLPDASIVGFDSRIHTIDEILHVTEKPMIVDGDTGGDPGSFTYLVRHLERIGVSAVVIEDKRFPKRNSLVKNASQDLEEPKLFAQKIEAGIQARASEDFLIIARLESLIAGAGLEDALARAEQYILAGADGIMVHSNKGEPDEVFAFAEAYGPLCQRLGRRPLLMCIPTTYNQVTDEEFASRGFNIVIYANHLLRAAQKAMADTAEQILSTGSTSAVEPDLASLQELFAVVGYDRLIAHEQALVKARSLTVIIPAAGRDLTFPSPKSLVPVAGKPVLAHQVHALRRAGARRVVVVRGYKGDQFATFPDDPDLAFVQNPHFDTTGELHSLFQARQAMADGFLMVYCDILFHEAVMERLVTSGKDVAIAIDSSYRYHRNAGGKRLDLVASAEGAMSPLVSRNLRPANVLAIRQIGHDVPTEAATHEFIGMVYFSPVGTEQLCAVYDRCARRADAPFHEAPDFAHASVTDLLQEFMDCGVPVYGQEVYKGWIEIHSQEDVTAAERDVARYL